MIVLTAGDHRFRDMIECSLACARRHGHPFRVYDLGGLGPVGLDMGDDARVVFDPAQLPDPSWATTFAEKGYYLELGDDWPTMALHKPFIIRETLRQNDDDVVYLDGDAMLLAPVDDALGPGDDLALALRPATERTTTPDLNGLVNAGVIFLANTERTRRFVDTWLATAIERRNDQVALNDLLFPGVQCWTPINDRRYRFDPPFPPSRIEAAGLGVRLLPAAYNCYEFPLPESARIVHFKGKRFRGRFAEFQDILRNDSVSEHQGE